MTREGFVDRVVHDFKYAVVEATLVSVADIHVGTLAYTFETFELLDLRRVVNIVFGRIGGWFCF